MKILLTSVLLLQCLLNEVRANLNGQTNERIPLLKEDGTATGTTITCSPYSVEDDIKDVEYVKYVLDTEEEAGGSVVWNSQSSKTLFEECASYAAERNAGMFYFDGDTCETSDTVYERKEKTCNSVAAKMVYMQKGFQSAVSYSCSEDGNSYVEGFEWNLELPCGVSGRKRCENGVIISEREINGFYPPHREGLDYFKITNGCFISPIALPGFITPSGQKEACFGASGAVPCKPPNNVDNETFTEDLKAFLDSSIVSSMSISHLLIDVQKNSTNQWNWHDEPEDPSHFLDTPDSENCLGFSGTSPHDPMIVDCDDFSLICCMW